MEERMKRLEDTAVKLLQATEQRSNAGRRGDRDADYNHERRSERGGRRLREPKTRDHRGRPREHRNDEHDARHDNEWECECGTNTWDDRRMCRRCRKNRNPTVTRRSESSARPVRTVRPDSHATGGNSTALGLQDPAAVKASS